MTDLPPVPALALPAPVLVVEDEPLVRARLERLLHQLGYPADALLFAGSLAEARGRLADAPVALALVDLGLPDGNGIELIAELRAADPALGILVISAWSTEDAILAALRAGATGYLLKERDDLEVLISLRSVLRGGAPIDPFVARRIIAELRPAPAQPASPPPGETLSPREDQILHLVAEGWATGRSPTSCICPATPSNATSSTSTASWRCPRAPGHPRGARAACSIDAADAGGAARRTGAGRNARPAGAADPVRRRAGGDGRCRRRLRRADPGRPHRPGPAGRRATRRRPRLAAGHAARRLSARWPGHTGKAWYRIDWRCDGASRAPAALALESIIMAGEVYANDDLLWRDASQSEPLSRSWNMPRYWRLPESAMRDGVNTIWVRVAGVAGQHPGWGRCTWASLRPSNAGTSSVCGATARCSMST